MKIEDIKTKAWNEVSKFNDLDDLEFNQSAISFKISDDYNLVVWCDLDYENDDIDRYYIVSVRDNPYDDMFGNDIGAEFDTEDISQDELNKAIDYVMSHKDLKGLTA